ncbi:MAG: hypothetical protein ACW99Q_16910 [Candidatus Kariarchaeaceae archaeon]|jgi:hypothetical protein
MTDTKSPLENSIIRKTGILYSYKKSVIFVLIIHLSRYFVALLYKFNDEDQFWDVASTDSEILIGFPLLFMVGAFVMSYVIRGIESFYFDKLKNDKFKSIFHDDSGYQTFNKNLARRMSVKYQLFYSTFFYIIFSFTLFVNLFENEYYFFNINIFNNQEYTLVVLLMLSFDLITSFLPALATYTLVSILIEYK